MTDADIHRQTQRALRERVKELTCLYGLARLVGRPELSLEQVLQRAVDLLPPAWQYPQLASARIVLDQREFLSRSHGAGQHELRGEILIDGKRRGHVEVTYCGEPPGSGEGPFLPEERNLIDVVAKELALIVEQRQAEEHRQRLQEQLRHADRLATIGQLAAGVAHELNEPLGGILGFAQLVQKEADLPRRASGDLDKIIRATLHAREVVKKLLLFARQAPPRMGPVDLNRLVEDSLYFLEARCSMAEIRLAMELEVELPRVTADAGQLYQVLVNLAVNAVQAMPDGGQLTFITACTDATVALAVVDTGEGMTPEVQEKIFLPFFTTKEVGEGTGLGLAVVTGIVSAHGGSIALHSEPGQGTRFTVHLPLEHQTL